MYKYHYIDYIRPIAVGSALYFGSALDKALNEVLKPTSNLTPEEVFLQDLSKDNAKYNPNILYSNSEYDDSLLTSEDYEEVLKYLFEAHGQELTVQDVKDGYNELLEFKKDKGFQSLGNKQKVFFNLLNWLSLYRKGLIILKDYREDILPQFKEIVDVQIELNYTLENGDVVNGFIDFIAKTQDDKIIIFDNKSSSSAYKADSVQNSIQLAIYAEALKTLRPEIKFSGCGYVVLRKKLKAIKDKTCSFCGHTSSKAHKTCDNEINGKRCGGSWNEVLRHKTQFQIITDEITPDFSKAVIKEYKFISDKIHNNEFPPNKEACNNIYGKPCDYYNLCHGNSMNGLTKLEFSKKDVDKV